MRFYEYRYIVGFEDTNLLGNVYYVNHLRWQGRCREMFLREHVPELLDELSDGLVLVTVKCSCEYFAEVTAFDEILIRMRLGSAAQGRMSLLFDYYKNIGNDQELVAQGEQQIACMRRKGGLLVPAHVPECLMEALGKYTGSEK